MSAISTVVVDESVYPRSRVKESTVRRYADALAADETLPPILLERGTRILVDGRHRLEAHLLLGLADIETVEGDCPPGYTLKLWAASLSSRHGEPLDDEDAKALARELYEQGGEVTAAAVAKALGRPRQTVDGWVSDLAENRRRAEEHAREVRRCLALLLRELGWTQQRVADALGVARTSVASVSQAEVGMTVNEAVLRDAVAVAPEDVRGAVEAVAQQWREERIFARWSDDERDLCKRLREGETVVVNMRADAHGSFWTWAEQAGMAVRVDRKSIWGNPFILPDDGTRTEVIDHYVEAYWPHKPSLHKQVKSLQGKALGCWCAPALCHADFLAVEADR